MEILLSNIEIGKNYSPNDLNEIIKDLYETNFFSNVSLNLIDGILTIDVKENKVIQEIKINGIKKKELVELLKKQLLSKDKNPFVESSKPRNSASSFSNYFSIASIFSFWSSFLRSEYKFPCFIRIEIVPKFIPAAIIHKTAKKIFLEIFGTSKNS